MPPRVANTLFKIWEIPVKANPFCRRTPCEWPDSERRRGTDRRNTKKAQFKYFLVNGRREQARREEDRARAYFFDRYNQRIFAAITAILMLSIFDAFLTLVLIEKGSSELNPVMAYFLEHGPLPFIIAKYILTSFGVIALLFCKNVFLSPCQHVYPFLIQLRDLHLFSRHPLAAFCSSYGPLSCRISQ